MDKFDSMESKELFSLGLSLEEPWYIKDIHMELYAEEYILHIDIGHQKGAKFTYEGEQYGVYDHQERTWQHLKFFQHKCQLHCSVPRIKLSSGKVKLVDVPWSSPGSSFTLLFEYEVLDLVKNMMSVSAASKKMGISSGQGYRIVNRHVSNALSTQPIGDVKELSVDETSTKKGHNYFTILTDREAKKVVGIGIGKDKDAFAHALIDMEIRGAERHEVRTVTLDMSKSYISAVKEYLSQAEMVFDRFHIMKNMNEAVDTIRKADRTAYEELKGSKYLWLKNQSKLSENQQKTIDRLSEACPNIGAAYRLKELLKLILDEAYQLRKVTPLNKWIKCAWDSGLAPIRQFVDMLHTHWYGIKTYFYHLKTNAFAERVNLKIQEIKRVAKGYRNSYNFSIMIYFHLGGLNLIPTTNE